VKRERATTVVEWTEPMRWANPPSEENVTELLEGRRWDSQESVEARLAGVDNSIRFSGNLEGRHSS